MKKTTVATVIAAMSLVAAGPAAAGSDNLPSHVGDPNSDNVGFFVPGGSHNLNTFGVFVPTMVPDTAGPNN